MTIYDADDSLRAQLAAHGDWCHECNAPQWVVGDGSHECTTVAELHCRLASARVVTDAMVERAEDAFEDAAASDGEPFPIYARPWMLAALTAALSEAP